VSIARALIREKAILLVGDGARQFAESLNAERADLEAASVRSYGNDTVGCVALDSEGNLAVATSTGGLQGAVAGRVGDVPLPGCGFYADNGRGALSLSGEGEAIARVLLAAETLVRMQLESVQSAAESALELLTRVNGEAGIIAIGRHGEIGWAHNSSHFAVALATAALPSGRIFLKKDE
jgi:beta-aspartyl-peptidase (threonine type)